MIVLKKRIIHYVFRTALTVSHQQSHRLRGTIGSPCVNHALLHVYPKTKKKRTVTPKTKTKTIKIEKMHLCGVYKDKSAEMPNHTLRIQDSAYDGSN